MKPLPAGLKTAQSLPQHLLSHQFHSAALTIIPSSQPAEFHAQLGSASCQVLSTSQLERVVYFNNQENSAPDELETLLKVGFMLASI